MLVYSCLQLDLESLDALHMEALMAESSIFEGLVEGRVKRSPRITQCLCVPLFCLSSIHLTKIKIQRLKLAHLLGRIENRIQYLTESSDRHLMNRFQDMGIADG